MKNQITKTLLSTAAVMLLTAGAALAQSSNSTAPGPTLQKEPGMASNNLPNPGTPQPQAETTTPTPVDQTVDQTPPAEPTDTMDTTTAPTPATTDTTVDTATGTSLPATGSDMPLVGLTGLLALGAGAGLWASRR